MNISGAHFLLVEDEPIIGFALEDMMLAEGAEATSACSFDEAMELVRTRSFDGAIVDVNLHGRTSYPLARELMDRDVFFVFATGYGEDGHPEEFATVPTLAKPYDMDSIRKAFEEQGQPAN
jgi:DNA-binding response OmpR family regulator